MDCQCWKYSLWTFCFYLFVAHMKKVIAPQTLFFYYFFPRIIATNHFPGCIRHKCQMACHLFLHKCHRTFILQGTRVDNSIFVTNANCNWWGDWVELTCPTKTRGRRPTTRSTMHVTYNFPTHFMLDPALFQQMLHTQQKMLRNRCKNCLHPHDRAIGWKKRWSRDFFLLGTIIYGLLTSCAFAVLC